MKYVKSIFETRVIQWGFRGDPDFWDYLAKIYENVELPYPTDNFEKDILNHFKLLTGSLPIRNKNYKVKEFSKIHKGMSTGVLSSNFWLDKGIPILLERLDIANKQINY